MQRSQTARVLLGAPSQHAYTITAHMIQGQKAMHDTVSRHHAVCE